jgi:hypothetical protein
VKRSGPLIALVLGVTGIVFLRLLIIDAQAASSADPAFVWAVAGVTVISMALLAVLVVSSLRFRREKRNKKFRELHPDATWVVGLANPDLEAQLLLLGAAGRLRPSFIAGFDRSGLGIWQGPSVETVLRLPWSRIQDVAPAEVSSGTRRFSGLEVQLTGLPSATLAFIARDPQRPSRALTQEEMDGFLENVRVMME